MSKILVVEDDFYLRRNLKEILVKNHYEVITAASVAEAMTCICTDDSISLYLLDVWLSDGDGFHICREIRKKNCRPVIFLTVCDDEDSVVKGLDMGADDYIVKPYRSQELLSRIQANLRRTESWKHAASFLSCKDILLDKKQGIVCKNNQELHLTVVEFELLLKLMENDGKIVRREQLLASLWREEDNAVEDNTLSVVLSRLRGKIGNEYIETVRGFGYRFVEKVDRGTSRDEKF